MNKNFACQRNTLGARGGSYKKIQFSMDCLGITSNIVFGIEACVQGKLQTSYSFDHWYGLGIREIIGMGIKKGMRAGSELKYLTTE